MTATGGDWAHESALTESRRTSVTVTALRAARAALGRHLTLPALFPWAILVLMLIVLRTRNAQVFTLNEINVTSADTLTLLLASVGQMIVIQSGGIDLSIGGVVSLASVVAATQMGSGGGAQMLGIAVLIVLGGTLAGAVNGAIIARTRIQPFIVTLATWSIWSGVALLILESPGGVVPADWVNWGTASPAGLATAVWLVLGLALFWGIFARTRLGLSIKALGSYARGARLSGVAVTRTLIATYALGGLFAALAALFQITQTATGSPVGGNEFILPSIAAVVIGGARLTGGRAGVAGTIAGAYTLSLVGDLVFWFNLDRNWQVVFFGLLLLIAVLINALGTAYAQRRAAWR